MSFILQHCAEKFNVNFNHFEDFHLFVIENNYI